MSLRLVQSRAGSFPADVNISAALTARKLILFPDGVADCADLEHTGSDAGGKNVPGFEGLVLLSDSPQLVLTDHSVLGLV